MGHCDDALMKLLHGSNWSDPSSGGSLRQAGRQDGRLYARSITFTLVQSVTPISRTEHRRNEKEITVNYSIPTYSP